MGQNSAFVKIKALPNGVDRAKVQEVITLVGQVLASAGYDQDIEAAIALGIYKAGLEAVRGWTPMVMEVEEVKPHDGSKAAGPTIQ